MAHTYRFEIRRDHGRLHTAKNRPKLGKYGFMLRTCAGNAGLPRQRKGLRECCRSGLGPAGRSHHPAVGLWVPDKVEGKAARKELSISGAQLPVLHAFFVEGDSGRM